MQKSIDRLKSTILTSQYCVPSSTRSHDPDKQKQVIYPQVENGLKVFRLQTRFLKAQISMTIALISHFILLISYFQTQFRNQNSRETILMGGFISASLFSVLLSCARFLMRNQIAQQRGQQKNNISKLLYQIIILLIQPIPWLKQVYIEIDGNDKDCNKDKASINQILFLLGISKMTFIIRGLLNLLTPYANPRQFRIARIYGAESDYLYQIRCLFRQHPVGTISIVYTFFWFLFAYCYRICQYGIILESKGKLYRNYLFENCLWMAMQTMTTVGYGDASPRTFLGGLVTILSCFTGVIGTSLLVLSITTNLQLGFDQERALIILSKMEAKRQIKTKSAMFIKICLWRMWTSYKLKKQIPISIKQRQLRRQLKQLRLNAKNHLKQSSRLQQSLQEQFCSVSVEVQTILNNCDQIILHCIKQNQIIEGVLRDVEKEKQQSGKLINYKQPANQNDWNLVSKKRRNHVLHTNFTSSIVDQILGEDKINRDAS